MRKQIGLLWAQVFDFLGLGVNHAPSGAKNHHPWECMAVSCRTSYRVLVGLICPFHHLCGLFSNRDDSSESTEMLHCSVPSPDSRGATRPSSIVYLAFWTSHKLQRCQLAGRLFCGIWRRGSWRTIFWSKEKRSCFHWRRLEFIRKETPCARSWWDRTASTLWGVSGCR